MDTALSILLSWQFILLALVIFTITWIIRTIFETIFTNLAAQLLWQKLALPVMPPIFGVVISFFAKNYTYPDGLTSTDDRLFLGLVAGMFSGLVFQIFKGMLKSKLESLSNPPTNVDGVGNKQP